jgi:hypothetical protein
MYCPQCGSNQTEGKRFCTVCGTNLQIVTQALSGQLQPGYAAPPVPHPVEIERQRETAKGVKLAIIGGGFVLFKLFGAIFTGSSLVNPFSIIGVILLAIGVSKLVANRPAEPAHAPPPHLTQPPHLAHLAQPVYSSVTTPAAPNTGRLPATPQPAPSVTEDDTRHLPHRSP